MQWSAEDRKAVLDFAVPIAFNPRVRGEIDVRVVFSDRVWVYVWPAQLECGQTRKLCAERGLQYEAVCLFLAEEKKRRKTKPIKARLCEPQVSSGVASAVVASSIGSVSELDTAPPSAAVVVPPAPVAPSAPLAPSAPALPPAQVAPSVSADVKQPGGAGKVDEKQTGDDDGFVPAAPSVSVAPPVSVVPSVPPALPAPRPSVSAVPSAPTAPPVSSVSVSLAAPPPVPSVPARPSTPVAGSIPAVSALADLVAVAHPISENPPVRGKPSRFGVDAVGRAVQRCRGPLCGSLGTWKRSNETEFHASSADAGGLQAYCRCCSRACRSGGRGNKLPLRLSPPFLCQRKRRRDWTTSDPPLRRGPHRPMRR